MQTVRESKDRWEALTEYWILDMWVLDNITDYEAGEAEQRLARGRKPVQELKTTNDQCVIRECTKSAKPDGGS